MITAQEARMRLEATLSNYSFSKELEKKELDKLAKLIQNAIEEGLSQILVDSICSNNYKKLIELGYTCIQQRKPTVGYDYLSVIQISW
jgi:hypothetical protein